MKNLIIIPLLVLVININAQVSDTEYFNIGLVTTGSIMVLTQLPQNGHISFDGHLSRPEKYIISGIVLDGLAVLNDQLQLVEIDVTKEKLFQFLLFTGAIITEGIGDSRLDRGLKVNGHFYNAISLSMIIKGATMYLHEGYKWKIGITYSLLRYSMFDYIYADDYNLPLDYRGTTSMYDRVLKEVPDFAIHASKGLAFLTGFVIMF